MAYLSLFGCCFFFFFQAEDGIRDHCVTGVQTCALPIFAGFRLRVARMIHCCLRQIPRLLGVCLPELGPARSLRETRDRKSTRLNSSHTVISYAVFCLKKKKHTLTIRSPRLVMQRLATFR